MARQARSVAKSRIEMDHMENRAQGGEAAPTVEEVAQKLREHVDAAVATLGKAAAEGDVQAAKTILDFVRVADQEQSTSKGRDMLKRIADIRAEAKAKRGTDGSATERPVGS